MGSRVEKHLSRLAMPRTWKIKRKGIKWVTRPNPGAHSFKLGMPLSVVMKNLIKCARTTKEVKRILYNEKILVDGSERKDHKHIVGLMDVISIPKTKENYRILFNEKGQIIAIPITSEESKIKVCKIKNKSLIKKGIVQLNLYDGKNILVKEDKYKVGDSVLIDIESKDIKESFSLEKGASIYLTGGKHIGNQGIVEDIKENKIIYKKDKDTFETLKKYAFVTGKAKPAIELKDKE